MSLSKKGSLITLGKHSPKNKGPSLNPNAAEFVPFALKSSVGMEINPDPKGKLPASGSQGKGLLDRTESSVSTNSDEEAHQYWQQQLPDDITPDFKVMDGEDPDRVLSLSLAGLSLLDSRETSSYSPTSSIPYMSNEHTEFSRHANNVFCTDKMRYSPSSINGDPSSVNFLQWQAKSWTNPVSVGGPFIGTSGDGTLLEGDNIHGYADSMLVADTSVLENNQMDPLDYLALQFPGFAAESLAEVYFANDCDFQMTMDILSQLELQVDGDFNRSNDSKTSSAPNLSSSDFPALLASHNKSGLSKYVRDEVPLTANSYISDKDNYLPFKPASSLVPRGSVDFASAVRKIASHDSGVWKYDGNVLADSSLGSSRTSPILARSNNIGPVHGVYGDKLQSRGSSRAIPVWLETGDAFELAANLYSELREDARDHARLRNAYFEQVGMGSG